MKDPEQEALIREVTEEVVTLTRKYKGLLWGEHGKGVRSEFSPGGLRSALSHASGDQGGVRPAQPVEPRQDRGAPGEGRLLTIDGVPTRGQHDRTIPQPTCGPASTRLCTATATAPATISIPTMPCARPGRRRASGVIRPRDGPR